MGFLGENEFKLFPFFPFEVGCSFLTASLGWSGLRKNFVVSQRIQTPRDFGFGCLLLYAYWFFMLWPLLSFSVDSSLVSVSGVVSSVTSSWAMTSSSVIGGMLMLVKF